MLLTSPSRDIFFSKNDPQDLRWGEIALNSTLPQTIKLVGYSDSRGVFLNGGRSGAEQAPSWIRKYFYKMTPTEKQLEQFNRQYGFMDLGDWCINSNSNQINQASQDHLQVSQDHLQASQDLLKDQTQIINHLKSTPYNKLISLGGGHDYGFVDGTLFLEKNKISPLRPVIINFDAHLDVRPFDGVKVHSGTPFFRLLEDYKNTFEFFELGLQKQCNSPNHWNFAQRDHKAHCYSIDQLRTTESLSELKNKLLKFKNHPCFLSIDIDVFSSALAPGCSQSWGQGMNWLEFKEIFSLIVKNLDIQNLGVYEVSPPLDSDHRTSKLAAEIIYHFIEDCQ